jgi:hypothetical protein
MREILGRRRRLLSQRSDEGPDMLSAALTFATEWQWPVLPGVATHPQGHSRCGCPDPDCTVPGAHPFDPGLLAATTDERMVRWWWTNRPAAPIILATGEPVMAIGGFNGTDPAPSLAEFKELVAQGKVHYFIGSSGGGMGGRSGTSSEIATWVAENFQAQTVGSTTVYDLTTS